MSTITDIEKLTGLISETDIDKLESMAALHRKQSNIQFKILEVDESRLLVAIEQEKTASGKYANQRTLVKRAHEVFDQYLPPSLKMEIEATEYLESPSAVVTPEWINRKMQEQDVRIKQIAFDTGIDRTDISGWINGHRPMSQIVKALFYYYFKAV
jgi:hypothetical protein